MENFAKFILYGNIRFWRGSKVGSVGGWWEVGGGVCIVVTEYNTAD